MTSLLKDNTAMVGSDETEITLEPFAMYIEKITK